MTKMSSNSKQKIKSMLGDLNGNINQNIAKNIDTYFKNSNWLSAFKLGIFCVFKNQLILLLAL